MSDNIITIKGKTYNLENIKAGLQQKDIDKFSSKTALSIFNLLDKENKYGFKNKVLDEEETKNFIQNLIKAAGNNNLSKAEAKKYFVSLGLNNLELSDISQFLDILIAESNEIKKTTYNNERNSVVIEYNEGYYNEVLYDGRQAIKAKESKDTGLQANLKMNVPFQYMKDRTGNTIISGSTQSEVIFDLESIILKNGIDTSNSKTSYYDKNQLLKENVIYYDNNGNEIMSVKYNNSNSNDIVSIEYKHDDSWIQMLRWSRNDIEKYLRKALNDQYSILDLQKISTCFSVLQLDENKKNVVSETCYFENTRVSELSYNPDTRLPEKTNFDYISGRKTSKEVFDTKGRLQKKQYFDANEQLEITEIMEYIDDNEEPIYIKKFDKNNVLIEKETTEPNNKVTSSGYYNIYNKGMQEKINYIKGELEKIIEDIVSDEDKIALKELITNKFNEFLDSDSSANKIFIDDCIKNPRIALNYFLTLLQKIEPNGVIDQVNYQGTTGDCWLLGAANSIAEVIDGGQDYINTLFVKNSNGSIIDENGNVKVRLNGGTIEYEIKFDELNSMFNSTLSSGEPDMKILEIAISKHLDKSTNGGKGKILYEVFSGNKTVNAIRENGKLYIPVNGENIELCEANADKLVGIPIQLGTIKKEDFKELRNLKHRTAMSMGSFAGISGHAMYIKAINENSVQVKEPHNTSNIATYSFESFMENFEDFTLFILP